MGPGTEQAPLLCEFLESFRARQPTAEEKEQVRDLVVKPALGISHGIPAAFEKPGEPEVSQQLVEIWNLAFPDEPLGFGEPGDHWRRLGFQSANPYSDVRGGRICLQQLHYLATQYPATLQKLAFEAQDPYYPFACACFNVTQLLVVFFHLHSSPCASPVPGAPTANCKQLQNFIALCQATKTTKLARHAELQPPGRMVLNDLFCALVEGLHSAWRGISSEHVVSLRDFPCVLLEVHKMHAAFWSQPVASPRNFMALTRRPCNVGLAEEGMAWLLAWLDGTRCTLKEVQVWLLNGFWTALRNTHGQLQEALTATQTGREEVLWHRPAIECNVDPDQQNGSYRPPELPGHFGPRARFAGALDVDAALSQLGMEVEEAKTMDAQGENLTSFLDRCSADLADGPGPQARPDAITKAKTEHQELHDFLDRCLKAKQVSPERPIMEATDGLGGLWDHFGTW